MPWITEDVERHKKGLTDNQKETWVKVANSALERCVEKGGKQGECEASAIRQANSINLSKEQVYVFNFKGSNFEQKEINPKFARFKKDLIRIGKWTHPEKKWELDVTKRRMASWIDNFHKMQANGIKVKLPYHHSYDPRDNAGFLTDLWIEEDALFGQLEIPNAKDIERIGTTIQDVSIGVHPNFVDGKGNNYGEVLEHVSLDVDPVVEGQHNFQKIAAGKDGELELIQFSFSETKQAGINLEGIEMIEQLRKLLGLAAEATEEDVLVKVKELIASLSTAQEKAKEQASLKEGKDKEDEKVFHSKAYLELSSKTEKLEAQLGSERLNRINLGLNRLQEKGKITPVIRKEIDGGQVLTFCRETFNDADIEAKEKMLKLFDMLPESAAIPIGERTKYFSQIENPTTGMTIEKAQKEAEKNLKAMGLKVGG